uniref:OrsajM_p27 n=1 Tax=Arundo donax TaxID=35708 RepID=A0A0A8Z684_ARUDO
MLLGIHTIGLSIQDRPGSGGRSEKPVFSGASLAGG